MKDDEGDVCCCWRNVRTAAAAAVSSVLGQGERDCAGAHWVATGRACTRL